MTKDTIGIDVSKATLDVFWQSLEAAETLPNSEGGFAQLCDWLGTHKDVLIVFEATGAYHRGLERYLSKRGVPFIKVNPKQARRFAQAIGKLAKTDTVDARMLARMGLRMIDAFCDSYARVPDRIVLDIDDTVDLAHGAQACKGAGDEGFICAIARQSDRYVFARQLANAQCLRRGLVRQYFPARC